jgi:hypothetical protein
MVDDQVGPRDGQPRELPLWMKLFSGFRVALDPKKLLLAAAGILVMAAGWYVLSVAYYGMRGPKPDWSDYEANLGNYAGEKPDEKRDNAWRDFKQARRNWNLMYRMAAPLPNLEEGAAPRGETYYDDADLADTRKEYQDIQTAKTKIEGQLKRLDYPVEIVPGIPKPKLKISGGPSIDITNEEAATALDEFAKQKKLHARDIVLTPGKEAKLSIHGVAVNTDAQALSEIAQFLRGARTEDQIRQEAEQSDDQATLKALALLSHRPTLRPAGQFRTWPWFEYRGPNPYLLVSWGIKEAPPGSPLPAMRWARTGFLRWFFADEVPVLLEPLIKFLRPIVYLLDPAAGGWNRVYLILIILWTLLTWAVFGGAITRMAAVQVARSNEKIGMTEALRFAWARVQGYFSAPVLPLVFLAILTIFLWLYGLVGVWTFFFGDIVVYGLFAPLMFLIGLIMAVVLVGLVGWPLMYSTISAEGSDSFDAISRSYSYVYQAPWHYLWYTTVALVYGAVLVFFVGLMGSLTVYAGKWGISQAPGPQSREPTYLFVYAPTSLGWRDLLMYESPDATVVPVARTNGTIGEAYAPTAKYRSEMSWNNVLGAFLVTIWLWLLFLMVVGFGYSYFWSAATIIYLLMRRKVDDTELDEIHLDEEDLEEPYAAPTPAAEAPTPADKAAGTGPPVTMVDSPTLRASGAAPPAPPPPRPEPVTAPAGESAVAGTPVPPQPAPAVPPPSGAGEGHLGPGSPEPHANTPRGPGGEGERP